MTGLLGGLTPAQFMRRHWQKKPLLARQAIVGFKPPVLRQRLFELARCTEVESRLIKRVEGSWHLRHGPFARRALPPLGRPGWTLLVQGIDRHDDAAHDLVQQHFTFIPDARFDDLMISYASELGGVGPHIDRYDVFLLQAHGQRRWRIGRPDDAELRLVPDLPLKILADFRPQMDFVLDAGDMLYLPPNWAHDGTAVGGDCITYSIGFRAPARHELAAEMLARIADDAALMATETQRLYRDPAQAAVSTPGAIPSALGRFAHQAVAGALRGHGTIERVLGEWLSEPHPSAWFDVLESSQEAAALQPPLKLDRRSRMFYDDKRIYLNGESRVMSGRDARVLRQLADRRILAAAELRGCSLALRSCLLEWVHAGWLHADSANALQRSHR